MNVQNPIVGSDSAKRPLSTLSYIGCRFWTHSVECDDSFPMGNQLMGIHLSTDCGLLNAWVSRLAALAAKSRQELRDVWRSPTVAGPRVLEHCLESAVPVASTNDPKLPIPVVDVLPRISPTADVAGETWYVGS